MNQKINIIYEDNHILVVEKPVNIPVQEDNTHDIDFLTILKQYIKIKNNKPGNVYLGLVHRLDRPVGGIMVFAKTSKSASRLSNQIKNNEFKKKYYAIVDGIIKENNKTLVDYLLKDEKNNIVKVDKNGKKAILEFNKLGTDFNHTLISINLKTGRSHQIRIQMSHYGFPLYGDQKYNKKAKKGQQIALFSYYISFVHTTTKKIMEFSLDIPDTNIWKLFN